MSTIRVSIINPARRSEQIARIVRLYGLNSDQEKALRLVYTPAPLRDLPDHGVRGKKSLGRIQQIKNRRRFKQRPAVALRINRRSI